ncbi:hypothetical protein ACJMK2_039353 [Sinanodonta woodiana]|uniref:Uncharacterized protein n=1 Tax=Sinanodonta woodiana TaxID=1069815 RepID=A0ABD3WD91_SINWO
MSHYDAVDPETYVTTFYSTIEGHKEEGDVLKFFLDSLHEAFKSGEITGQKLLDVGTGPIPNMAFCAAPWFKEITHSDFSQKNLDSIEERQEELRRKISNIVFCDVTKPNPVASTAVDGDLFDAITCSNCLECATVTLDEYAKSVRNLSSLLKPGGRLVLEGALDQTFYRVGDISFECTPITEDQLRDIFQKEGFEILSVLDLNKSYTPHMDESNYSDFKNAFAMVAKKVQ